MPKLTLSESSPEMDRMFKCGVILGLISGILITGSIAYLL